MRLRKPISGPKRLPGLSRRGIITGLAAVTATVASMASSGVDAAPGKKLRMARSASVPAVAAFDGVNTATMAARALHIAYFNDSWDGHTGQTFTTTNTYNNLTDLNAALVALPGTGWHLLRLNSSAPATNWNGAIVARGSSGVQENVVTGHLFGGTRDWVTNGGGVVIESTDPLNPVMIYGTGSGTANYAGLTAIGIRGLHVRNITFAARSATTSQSDRTGTRGVSITRNNTYKEAPIVRIENCNIGGLFDPTHPGWRNYGKGVWVTSNVEQVDIINCKFWGNDSAFVGQGVRRIRRWGNDFRRSTLDNRQLLHKERMVDINSSFSEMCFGWDRLNTVRDPENDPEIAFAHADSDQSGTPTDVGGYSFLKEFEVDCTPRTAFADQLTITLLNLPTDGQTLTMGPDVYTFRNSPSAPRDIQIGATRAITAVNVDTAFKANTPTGVSASGYTGNSFLVNYLGGVATELIPTATANISITGTRYGNNTQGRYPDDSPYPINTIEICCYRVVSTGNSGRTWNGTYIIDRCTYARTGNLPPNASVAVNGFFDDIDPEANITCQRGAAAASVTMRNSVLGLCIETLTTGGYVNRSTNGTYGNGSDTSLVLADNTFCGWRVGTAEGSRPEDLMAGTFVREPSTGRVIYDIDTDGSQELFRAEVHAQLMLANPLMRALRGPTNPATWPTA
jgi:hypothetical protein